MEQESKSSVTGEEFHREEDPSTSHSEMDDKRRPSKKHTKREKVAERPEMRSFR